MKKALVCGAGGFIGSHLVKRLKKEGYWVRGIDLKFPEFSDTKADHFIQGDLRDLSVCKTALTLDSLSEQFDEVYQLAAQMGGAGFVFTGENDADIMHDSTMIHLNILNLNKKYKKIFFSGSACCYPEYNQTDPDNPNCSEDSAYPAQCDSEYGWEKLYAERLYFAFMRNKGIDVKVARFHNIMGIEGTWQGGREKAPAAICRKVGMAKDGDTIEIWGSGKQTRSFLYIDECLDGVRTLMKSDFSGPVNIGSEEMISIDNLTLMAIGISKKKLYVTHIDGPVGVNGRNSDNTLCKKELSWEPKQPLVVGITKIYNWICDQL